MENRRTARGEKTTHNTEAGQNKRESPEQTVGEFPRLLAGTVPHVIGEDRNEGSCHRPFSDQAAEEVRDAVRQNERIGDARRSQEQSQTLIADIPENSTDNRNDANNRSRFEDLPLVGQDVRQKIEAPSLSPSLNPSLNL